MSAADVPGRAFLTADVFTDQPFGGNPLAVLPDADGLDEGAMQRIAREFNLSETTFVLRPTRPDCDLRFRIFTPEIELPFAGHPTIGGVLALVHLGRISPAGDGSPVRVVIEEAAGPVPVDILADGAGGLPRAVMGAPRRPEPVADAPARADLAALLSLPERAIADGALVASAGMPFLFVPLAQDADLDRCRPDVAAAARLLPEGAPSRLVYPMVVDRAARTRHRIGGDGAGGLAGGDRAGPGARNRRLDHPAGRGDGPPQPSGSGDRSGPHRDFRGASVGARGDDERRQTDQRHIRVWSQTPYVHSINGHLLQMPQSCCFCATEARCDAAPCGPPSADR